MAHLLSQPTIVLVQPPSRFASGTDRGSFAAGVWTPGRDASGVVNQVSWDLVPSGQWTKVAGTSFFNLDAMVKAINPAWRDYGTSGFDWDQTLTIWTGAAHDPNGARLWMAVAGGHAGSSNNGIYRFDAYKMAWNIENMPSDPTPWSTSYKNSAGGSSPANTYTYCTESDATPVTGAYPKYLAGTLSAINDVGYDELVWDGKPTSRHTYNGVAYCPNRNEIVVACRRLWTYNLGSGTWNYKRAYNDDLASVISPIAPEANGHNHLGEATFTVYDETNSDVLMTARAGTIDSAAFNLSTKTWNTSASTPTNGWTAGAIVRYGRNVTVVRNPGSGGNGGPREYGVFNLDSRTFTSGAGTSWTLGPGVGDFRNDLYQPTLMYVPSINRYWYCTYTNTSANMVWHEIDPTTTPWTMTLKTFAGNVPTPPVAVGGSFCEPGNKHMFIPSMNALIYFFRGGTETMYVYKF